MKFSIATQDLNAGISTAIKALSQKGNIDIYECIFIEAYNGKLMLRCTDLSTQIDTLLPATMLEDGVCCVQGKLFAEMMRKLSGDEVDIELSGNTMNIRSGASSLNLSTRDYKDFIAMNVVKKNYVVKTTQRELKNLIKMSTFAAASEDNKVILTGALMEFEGEKLKIVALDGFRLSMCTCHMENTNDEPVSAVVYARTLNDINKILMDDDTPVSISVTRSHIEIDLDYTKITVRLLEGNYIKYKQMIPTEHKTRVRIKRTEILDSIDRVSLMARESKANLVKLSFKNKELLISANSEVGHINDALAVETMGDDIDIAFNPRYILDIFKVIDDEYIYMDMSSAVTPAVIRPIQNESYLYLVLPVRLFSQR